MARLEGKVAIITGAADGMGLAAAELFAREGAEVVAGDVSPRLTEAIEALDLGIVPLRLDVADAADWDAAVATALERFGRIDILVNNAGVHLTRGIEETTPEEWDRVMAVNTTGVWLGTKAVLPHMKAAGGGSIVNCSSLAGIAGGFSNDGGGAAYSASKGAVRSFTKHTAQHHASSGIRANSVHPGGILTGMARAAMGGAEISDEMRAGMAAQTPLPPHIGDPIDIAYAYLYLASDESRFVTGAELVVDGGSVTH